ncbi:hypothetical protein [Pseudomonas syringae]|uniref:hypothetical protein n=1 Tax=Pseudomonas syringae TaxID=317 RepID=UPI00051645E0|nr:hypothetical protein [Pseudomonas syringae]
MKIRPADFEESEYRGPLFNQLLRGNHLLWEPGQVFEQYIGVDYAAFAENDAFWKLRRSHMRSGAILGQTRFDYIWKKKKKGKTLPPFKLNIFIQAKRSNSTPVTPKKARDKGLLSSCWFFNVETHQQAALHRLSSQLGGHGIVCYAAPAFDKQMELYINTENRTMVQNSTFPAAGKLAGHGRWYYDRAGRFGVANPDFQEFELTSINDQITTLIEQSTNLHEGNASEMLNSLAKFIDLTIDTASEVSSRDTFFSYLAQILEDEASEFIEHDNEPLRNYLRIRAFCIAYELQWFTIL